MINPAELRLLSDTLDKLAEGYAGMPDFTSEFDAEAVAKVLQTVAERMQDNYPYYHPLYAGHRLFHEICGVASNQLSGMSISAKFCSTKPHASSDTNFVK